MDVETFIWTLVLFGGTIVVVVWLLIWAWRIDRAKSGRTEQDADT